TPTARTTTWWMRRWSASSISRRRRGRSARWSWSRTGRLTGRCRSEWQCARCRELSMLPPPRRHQPVDDDSHDREDRERHLMGAGADAEVEKHDAEADGAVDKDEAKEQKLDGAHPRAVPVEQDEDQRDDAGEALDEPRPQARGTPLPRGGGARIV